MSDPQANKQTAMDFYDLMFNDSQPREAIERYAGADYRQHNPGVGDGKEAFIDYFERMAASTPASASSSSGPSPKATTSSCTATSTGPATTTTRASTSSGSTRTARSSSTGTSCRSVRPHAERQRDVLAGRSVSIETPVPVARPEGARRALGTYTLSVGR